MRSRRSRQQRFALFEASLASGIGQALAGWAAEYTHTLLERDPALRAELHKNWMAMYRRIAQLTQPRRRRRRGAQA